MTESMGGQAGAVLATQYGLTAGLVTYASLKRTGFRMTPFGVAKVPQYAGIFFSSYLAYQWGMNCSRGTLGDSEQFRHLIKNKRNILSGQKSWDGEN